MANGDETKDNQKIKRTNELANNDKSVVQNYTLNGAKSTITTGPTGSQVLTHFKDGAKVSHTQNKADINKYTNQIKEQTIKKGAQELAKDIQKVSPTEAQVKAAASHSQDSSGKFYSDY